jgi:hypothetical protein
MTPRQIAGLAAATAAFNEAHKDAPDFKPLSTDDYLAARTGELLDSYATTYGVGFITPYAFVERFVKEGVYDQIVAAANAGDKAIAGYLDTLRAKSDDVNLLSPTVAAGLGYLQQIKLITADQAARIGSVA